MINPPTEDNESPARQTATRTLCPDENDEILASWIEEAERRGDAHERGEMGAIDFDESIALARARIAAWEKEIAHRTAQLDTGEVETEPAERVIAELRAQAKSST